MAFRTLYKTIIIFLTTLCLHAGEIIIFHTNDSHGTLEESETSIGYAKLATYINDAKKSNKNVLFLDAGNILYGSSIANFSQGAAVVEVLNKIGIDGITLGSHDFRYGVKQLAYLERRANFPILAANVIDSRGKNVFYSNFIKKVGGLRIGVFGITTPEAMYKTNPDNIKGLIFLDPKEVALKQTAELKFKGADIIIALTNLGLSEESALEHTSIGLTDITDIDIIVDGRTNTALSNGLIRNGVIITQSGALTESLGYISIFLESKNGIMTRTVTPSIMNKKEFDNITPDSSILKIINKYNKKYLNFLTKEVVTIPITLNGSRNTVRTQETNFSILLADSIKKATDADISFINAGTIRSSINAGDVTMKDIFAALPFEDYIATLELSGANIVEILEFSARKLPNPTGGFLHASGITYTIDTSNKKRVSNIKINGNPINSTQVYKVATVSFIAAAGDGYTWFLNHDILTNKIPLYQIFADYLKNTDLNNYDFSSRITIQ